MSSIFKSLTLLPDIILGIDITKYKLSICKFYSYFVDIIRWGWVEVPGDPLSAACLSQHFSLLCSSQCRPDIPRSSKAVSEYQAVSIWETLDISNYYLVSLSLPYSYIRYLYITSIYLFHSSPNIDNVV